MPMVNNSPITVLEPASLGRDAGLVAVANATVPETAGAPVVNTRVCLTKLIQRWSFIFRTSYCTIYTKN